MRQSINAADGGQRYRRRVSKASWRELKDISLSVMNGISRKQLYWLYCLQVHVLKSQRSNNSNLSRMEGMTHDISPWPSKKFSKHDITSVIYVEYTREKSVLASVFTTHTDHPMLFEWRGHWTAREEGSLQKSLKYVAFLPAKEQNEYQEVCDN